MSLLDRSPQDEPCLVYPEIHTTDSDGNTVTKASPTGIPTRGRFQIFNQSGTSSRLQESNDEGYQTEMVYSVRFPRAFEAEYGPFGAQSKVSWGTDDKGRPKMFEFFGDAIHYPGSWRTAHTIYTLRRY
jgi:hypothetical protein